MEATSPVSTSVEMLEEQLLTCKVCLNFYTDPKQLPCHHSFCQKCLIELPKLNGPTGSSIKCPLCRSEAEIPQPGGIAELPSAFELNQLKEIYRLMKMQLKNQEAEQCSVPTHDELIKYYCNTCNECICRDCALLDHSGHKYKLIFDVFATHYRQLKSFLSTVKNRITDVEHTITSLSGRQQEIQDQSEIAKKEIQSNVEEIIKSLKESESKLLNDLDKITATKLQALADKKESTQVTLQHLSSCKEMVEHSLNEDNCSKVLKNKKEMMDCMSDVVSKSSSINESVPSETGSIQDIDCSLGYILLLRPTALKQQDFVGKVSSMQYSKKDNLLQFMLSLSLSESPVLSIPIGSIKCSLIPVNSNNPVRAAITADAHLSGVYKIACSPSVSGIHKVEVQVHNVQLADTCTSLFLPLNPYLIVAAKPLYTVTGVKRPWGVAVCSGGHIAITEWGNNCVSIFYKNEQKLVSIGAEKTTGSIELSAPRGIAITQDNFILVTDRHRIQKMTMNGVCIESVGGEKGNERLQFNTPSGLAISSITEQIFIADRYNHRIQVLNHDFTFSKFIGEKGTGRGEFDKPRSVAIDNRGSFLYVTDCNNHRIQKFTLEGEFVAQFGSKGSGPGELNSPGDVAVDDDDLVYVSEWENRRVSVFTSDGDFVRCYGGNADDDGSDDGSVFRASTGIAFDAEGTMYVCDFDNNSLVMY